MRGRSVEKLVYEFIFPKPKANDPQNFQALLTRNLIPEVRQETQAFYGHLDTQEAKYPGLDYTHKTHRIRLRRWPWHTKLFRAFDELGLTPAEIAGLTRWEGTKWAKEKFESEQGITIRDTTADDIPEWDDEQDGIVKSYGLRQPRVLGDEEDDETSPDEDEEEEQSDDELESVGIELNQRLRAGAARREAGDTSAVLDEEWEQWFKNALESGLIHDDMTEQAFRQLLESTVVPTGLIPVNMVSAARAGQWSEIPERLQPILRRSLRSETASAAAQEYRSSRIRASWSPATTRLSGLRLPAVGESTSSRRSAGAPGALRS